MFVLLSVLSFTASLTAHATDIPPRVSSAPRYTVEYHTKTVPFFPDDLNAYRKPLAVGSGFHDILDTLNSLEIYDGSYGDVLANALIYATCTQEEREILWCAFLVRAMAVPKIRTTLHHYPDGTVKPDAYLLYIKTMRDLYEHTWKPMDMKKALGLSALVGIFTGGIGALIAHTPERHADILPNDVESNTISNGVSLLLKGTGIGLAGAAATFGLISLGHALRPILLNDIEHIVHNLKMIQSQYGHLLPSRITDGMHTLFSKLRKYPGHHRSKEKLKKRHDLLLNFYLKLKKTVSQVF